MSVAYHDAQNLLDSVAARSLTDQIKVAIEGTWQLVKVAYEGRAWVTLGYESWDDYCTREFGTARIRLPREERSEVVASLRESGLSLRAIAAVTGNSVNTIREDVYQTDTPAAVTGTDGKTYTQPPAPTAATAKPRRSPLADAARSAAWQIRKAAERVVRVCEDDRFNTNKKQVADEMLDHLLYTIEVCQDLYDSLKESQ